MKNIVFTVFIVLIFNIKVYSQNCWQSVSAGVLHTLAIKTDGTLWAWGSNGDGQLGIDSRVDKSSPVQTSSNKWLMVATGGGHSLALRADSTLWGWGASYYGQAGIGGTILSIIPVQIGTAKWRMISAGFEHSLAIKSDGTLWAWGNNSSAPRLGIGSDRSPRVTIPTQVGTDNSWLTISAGETHSLAIKNDGTLWVWGNNQYGQLGIGSQDIKEIPTQISSDNNWKFIDAGTRNSIAIKKNGTLWAWGSNEAFQLGDNTQQASLVPKQIGIDTDWRFVNTENGQVLAIKNDNTLWTWGNGLGNPSPAQTPTKFDASSNWQSISTGLSYSIAIKSNGALMSVGWNTFGQLGDGTLIDKKSFATISCNPTSIETIDNQIITLFPIPTMDFIEIILPNPNIYIVNIEINDLLGASIIKQISSTNHLKTNVSILPRGAYLLKIQTSDDKIVLKKIIKY